MISIVRNGNIIMYPRQAPVTWTDPDSGMQWSNFNRMSDAQLITLGMKTVVDNPTAYYEVYEIQSIGNWRYDTGLDIVTRDYTVTDKPIETVKAERLAAVRAECKNLILAVISIEHQMDIALGIDPDLGYTEWIAVMRIESNRCEDIYDAATTMDDLKAVAWKFPKYTGGE